MFCDKLFFKSGLESCQLSSKQRSKHMKLGRTFFYSSDFFFALTHEICYDFKAQFCTAGHIATKSLGKFWLAAEKITKSHNLQDFFHT